MTERKEPTIQLAIISFYDIVHSVKYFKCSAETAIGIKTADYKPLF